MKPYLIMKHNLLRNLTAAALVAGVSLGASAIPAKPGLRSYTQPDGSKIMIELRGDHRHNAVFSEDGYLLMTNAEGGYEYAIADPSGRPVLSGVVAQSPKMRSATERQLLATIDREAMRSELQKDLERIPVRRSKALTRTPGDTEDRLGLCPTSFPHFGSPRALVILVEYSDRKFNLGDNAHDYFNNMLNEEGFSGYGATGSARDWFIANSNGQFSPQFDLYGPVTLPNKMSYYGKDFGGTGGEELNAHEMVIDACKILDPDVDFSVYDTDGDGYVDNVFVFYAGYGQNSSGLASTVWPHSADIEYYTNGVLPEHDGVKVNHYACTNEQPTDYDHPDGMGTFIHEFSHVLGLPDLYSTVYNNAFTPGEWSTLDYGPYNNEGRTPPNYSAYERYVLNWMTPRTFDYTGDYKLNPLGPDNDILILPTENPLEYYLFENRQPQGYDTYLPGHGMLVWHIDYIEEQWIANSVNNNSKHQCVDLIEADDRRSDFTLPGDPFPGTSKVTSFTSTSVPALLSWNNQPLGVEITNIAEKDGIITFDADVKDAPEGSASISESIYASDLSVNGRTLRSTSLIEVYDLTGRLAASGNEITLTEPGLYVVRNNGATRKIVIR